MSTAGKKSHLRLAADLDVMWADLPVLDRIEAAGTAGFEGIALSDPYDLPAKELQREALRAGVTLVRIASPPPNYTGGARGFAATVDGEARFQHDLRRALRYCTALQVPMLQLLAGPGDTSENRNTLRSNLEHAAVTAPAWMRFVIGPEGYDSGALSGPDDCAAFLDEIDTRHLALQFPCALSDSGLARARRSIQRFGPRVTALVLETEPEPKPALALGDFTDAVTQAGFEGWFIAAYPSQKPTEDTLGWMPATSKD